MATTVVVTSAGDAVVAKRMIGATPTQAEPYWVAWGTGTTATAAKSSTALETAAPEARVQGTSSNVTTTYTDDTYQVVGTLTAGEAETITEAGLFDASTAGDLFTYATFTGFALNTGDSIQFTFKVSFD